MTEEKLLLRADSPSTDDHPVPTGFSSLATGLAHCLADDYDIYYLGLQSQRKRQAQITKHGDTRNITVLPNIPRENPRYDFGFKSLPRWLDEIEPDMLITTNDIQMVQDVPNALAPSEINLDLMDKPANRFKSEETLKRELEAEILKHKEKYPRDIKWLAYCFTPDTSVLTPEGIKNITNFEIGDEVYTLNPETEEIEISNVTDTQEYEYEGDLIDIQHQKVDYKITPEHLFYLNGKEIPASELKNYHSRKFPNYKGFRGQDKKWFNFYENFNDGMIIRVPYKHASEIKDIRSFTTRGTGKELENGKREKYRETLYKEISNSEDKLERILGFEDAYAKTKSRTKERIPLRVKWKDFLSLSGWYISEGYLDTHSGKFKNSDKIYQSYRVNISQENPENREEITALLSRIGLEYYCRKSVISTNSEFLYHLFAKLFHNDTFSNDAKSKYIPHWIFKYDKSEYLFEALMNGDGIWNKRDNRIGQYTTASPRLRDDFVILCYLLGYKAQIYSPRTYSTKKGEANEVWSIGIGGAETQPIIKSENHIAKEEYKGRVYDISTDSNHLIFAGRNNKFNITHQCPQDAHPGMPQWKFIYDTADQVVAFCEYGQDIFRKYFNMRVPYIYHGVDTDLFHPNPQKPPQLQDAFIVGDMNRNQPRKQPYRLMAAFAEFAKDKDDVLLHMQMDWQDDFGWPIEVLARRLGILGKMIRPKPVGMPKEEVAECYNMWDIHGSATAGEGFGFCTIEALSTATPVVATDYTTSEELLIQGSPSPRGKTIPYATLHQEKLDTAAGLRSLIDVRKMAQAFEEYYHDRDAIRKHGQNGRKWAVNNVDWRVIEPQWKKMVKKTLDS